MKLLVVAPSTNDQALLSKMFANGNHQLTVVADADSALTFLSANNECDVVLASSSLNNIAIGDFFALIAGQAPKAIRLAINDTNSDEAFKNAHHKFAAPLTSQALVKVLEQALNNQKDITKQIIVKAVSEVKTLPSPPKVYMQAK